MYGQIISFLFVLLILYYVVMILLDIQKAKAEKAAQLENNSEEEIDISDEANSFKPVMITRDSPGKKATQEEEQPADESMPGQTDGINPKIEDMTDKIPSSTLDINDVQEHQSPENSNEDKSSTDKSNDSHSEEKSEDPAEKTFRRKGYREPLMTDGLEVSRFIEEAEILVETGKGPLGGIVYEVLNT